MAQFDLTVVQQGDNELQASFEGDGPTPHRVRIDPFARTIEVPDDYTVTLTATPAAEESAPTEEPQI